MFTDQMQIQMNIYPFVQATTIPAKDLNFKYQPLETFGDSILKFSAALCAYEISKCDSENYREK